MPCDQHIGGYSLTCWECIPWTYGFHKQPEKPTNGNCLRRVVSESEVASILKSSSSDLLSEQCRKFILEARDLIKVLENKPKNLEAVKQFVQKYNDKQMTWNNDDYLRLCDLNGTIYMGQKYMQDSWEELYLPKKTRMQVFGTLENSRVILPSLPWIILVGEDGCIYAYGEEELQLIAKSLLEFVKNGKRKVYETYSYPESSEEEDESLQQDEEILKIRQRTKDFVNQSADEFDDFLKLFSK